MAYRVKAGFVSAETQVHESGSRAVVDIPRGAELPGDVPEEQLQRFLRLGHIESVEDEFGGEPAEESEEDEVEDDELETEEDGDVPTESDDLVDLDKDALVALAEQEDVTLDGRWGVDKIADAIREHRAAQD